MRNVCVSVSVDDDNRFHSVLLLAARAVDLETGPWPTLYCESRRVYRSFTDNPSCL